tara:strand:+ start:3412 stop:10917 length:7506 start_codon:yes stop_codon:yes gene_type:complete
MKYTRRLIIIPDAEIGPEAVDDVKSTSASGSSSRVSDPGEPEASPVISNPERGSRYRQYQRQQSGVLTPTNSSGTAVSEPVKKFSNDTVVQQSGRNSAGGSQADSREGESAVGTGDISPTLSGIPESKQKFNLLVSGSGSSEGARFSFNMAEESRNVRVYSDSSTSSLSSKVMPGDAQFRCPPTIFNKAPDVLVSTDGRSASTYSESPAVTPALKSNGNPHERPSDLYYCRPKLLPLKDGRLMSVYIQASLPPHHWAISNLGSTVGSGASGETLSTRVLAKYLDHKSMKWGLQQEVDPRDELISPYGDITTHGDDSRPFSSFADVVQYDDTGEIVMVVGSNAGTHSDTDLFAHQDYPPFGNSDQPPTASDEPRVSPSTFGGSWVADDRHLAVLYSTDGGQSWDRRSLVSLKTKSSPIIGTSTLCEVPGIDPDDSGVILGGACELTSTGRLLVTVCTGENIYVLSSDNRGESFKASLVKKVAVGHEEMSVVAIQDTPPPNEEAILGQLYIPTPYKYKVQGVVSSSKVTEEMAEEDGDVGDVLPSGVYIIAPGGKEFINEGGVDADRNLFFGMSGEIVVWEGFSQDNPDGKIVQTFAPANGDTAFADGTVSEPWRTFHGNDAYSYGEATQGLIYDSQATSGSSSGSWLVWDARGEWKDFCNASVVEYVRSPDESAPTGWTRVWREAKDIFGNISRTGIILRVLGGSILSGLRVTPNVTRQLSPLQQGYTGYGPISSTFDSIGWVEVEDDAQKVTVITGRENPNVVREAGVEARRQAPRAVRVSMRGEGDGPPPQNIAAPEAPQREIINKPRLASEIKSVDPTIYSVKARDTLMSAGMTRTDSGEVIISVTHTDFSSVMEAPTFLSGSAMFQCMKKNWADAGAREWIRQGEDGGEESSTYINPRIYFTGRRTSVFVTSNGENFSESVAWQYSGTGTNVTQTDTDKESVVFSTKDGTGFSESQDLIFGPSCFESAVTIRPDGFGQVYGASHNWMGPQFLGPQADRALNGYPNRSALLPSDSWPQSLGIMNTVASATFSKTGSVSNVDSGAQFASRSCDILNATNAGSLSRGSERDKGYDLQENEVSSGKTGTLGAAFFQGADPRRISNALPCHGTTSHYLPNGIIHPGLVEFKKYDGTTYRFSLLWGTGPMHTAGVSDGNDDQRIIGYRSNITDSIADNSGVHSTFGFWQDMISQNDYDHPDTFINYYGCAPQFGALFYTKKDGKAFLRMYKSGEYRNASSYVDVELPEGEKIYDAQFNLLIEWTDGNGSVHGFDPVENVYKNIYAPNYTLSDSGSSLNRKSLGKYYVGLAGGVTGVDAVQWRGETVIIAAHTSQYNVRSSSWDSTAAQGGAVKTRMLMSDSIDGSSGNEGYLYDYKSNDNSSIVIYRTSNWSPVRENLGRIDNSWDIGMGTGWPDTVSLYSGQWNNREQVNQVTDKWAFMGGNMLNGRHRLVRMMSGRWYQSTFDGQRDPKKLGWNFESSSNSEASAALYLVDTGMIVAQPQSGSAPLQDVLDEGGGSVMWRGGFEKSGNCLYLGAVEHSPAYADFGFLPFSEGRQCSPVSRGMGKTPNGAPLVGGFRAVFSPFSAENFSHEDFKLFFSLMLTNNEWRAYGENVQPNSAGIIVSIGMDVSTTPKMEMQCYDAALIHGIGTANANVQAAKIGKPVEFTLPSSGIKFIELLAGFEETAHKTGIDSSSWPLPICYHGFARVWDKDSDPDWIGSFSTLCNYKTVSIDDGNHGIFDAVTHGPKVTGGNVSFGYEHFAVGNLAAGLDDSQTHSGEAGIVIKSVSLHRPGQHIKGFNATPTNAFNESHNSVFAGAGIYDVRAFGTAKTFDDSEAVVGFDGEVSNCLTGDVSSFGVGIDPRSIIEDTDTSNFYYGAPLFKTSAGGAAFSNNDSGLLNPSRTQIVSPYNSWIARGVKAGWRGRAQTPSTFAVETSHLFSASNALEGPVTKTWRSEDGKINNQSAPGTVHNYPIGRVQNYGGASSDKRYALPEAYIVEDIEIVLDSWGESGDASSGDYTNDIYNSIGTSKQFSPNGIAIFGKNFPAFEISFCNSKSGFDDNSESHSVSFGLPGDGRVSSNSADWFSHEPDKYIHMWAWTSESFSVGSSNVSPSVSGGKDKFPYFGDYTFTYRKNVSDEEVTSIDNIYAKNNIQDKLTPWMPHQYRSDSNGPSFYLQVISESMAGSGDQACRFVFKIKDNTEDTLILEDNPLRTLSQFSYDQNNQSPFQGEYRSWKAVAIFSDRMASEIVYNVLTDESKRVGPDGFPDSQVPSLPGSGFRYARIKIRGCTRFGSEKSQRMGRLVLGRLLDLSGPDFEWGWQRSEQSGVKVLTTRGGQRYARQNHAPRRVFNLSHHPLEPPFDLPPGNQDGPNYFESPVRGFGSSFGPGWKQEKRKWEEVVALLRSLGPGYEQAALVFEGDSALASKQPGSDNFSRTKVPTDPTSLCLVRLTSYGQMTHKGYVGREVRVPEGSQSDATTSNESFGSTVCRPRPIIEVTAIQFEEEF